MTIDRIFLIFMSAVGIAVGSVLVVMPESREFLVPPYFWVLGAMAIFEAITFAAGRGAPGTIWSLEARLLGFMLAMVLMVVIPIFAGTPGRLF
jgi:hypothetical protein